MTSDICRLCLNNTQVIYNVFEYSIEELQQIILRCTSVEISQDDELPNGVCTTCIQTVTQFDFFRKQCQNSDGILKKQYLKNTSDECDNAVRSHNKYNNSSEGCKILSNTFKTENRINFETSEDAIKIRNIRPKQKIKTDLMKTKICTINNQSDIENDAHHCNTDDDENVSNHSDSNYNDLDCRPPDDTDLQSDYVPKCTSSSLPTFASNVPLGKKKCKIKKLSNKSNQERDVKSHLVYTEQDYAILGRERKVRIYEIDDTMKEIIGYNIYVCEICMTEFDSFFEYYDHQEIHSGELAFKCSKCNEIFSNRQDLVDHDARHKIPCHICELELLPKSMSAHLLIHTDVHKCPECGMRHTSNASLEKHIKARHTGIKGFVCHVCGKQSSCQSSMNRHMAYHSNERPYKCKYCDFCAKSLNIVQVHTSRKHFAEKCVCEICAKLFKSQPSLIQHMKRIHTARKHVCDICGKAFIERYNLNRHLKKHAGQRLHECKICHKEFFTIRKLKEHMHSHRQGCVNCPKCGKEFFYKKYYTKHVLKCTKTDNNSIATNSSQCISVISSFQRFK